MHRVFDAVAAAREVQRQPAVHQFLVGLSAGTPDGGIQDLDGGSGGLHQARVPTGGH
ncbi:hypothetical protein Cme02nite_61420 [Catellatospora methionotrophica]|uniref:Uncharacterized protein n=1 Tax=Catellatospora methionotrophica TaxID=121620 RepID=A0A8J3LGB4_9ACTN|nr:hypothetical protein Cme02nite_61420 [Catellatospora methionotrophica]